MPEGILIEFSEICNVTFKRINEIQAGAELRLLHCSSSARLQLTEGRESREFQVICANIGGSSEHFYYFFFFPFNSLFSSSLKLIGTPYSCIASQITSKLFPYSINSFLTYVRMKKTNITKPQMRNGSKSHLNSKSGGSCVRPCCIGVMMTWIRTVSRLRPIR
jgi:hypothetical protein